LNWFELPKLICPTRNLSLESSHQTEFNNFNFYLNMLAWIHSLIRKTTLFCIGWRTKLIIANSIVPKIDITCEQMTETKLGRKKKIYIYIYIYFSMCIKIEIKKRATCLAVPMWVSTMVHMVKLFFFVSKVFFFNLIF